MPLSVSRRGFLRGLIAAPLVVRTPGILMPIKPLKPQYEGFFDYWRSVGYASAYTDYDWSQLLFQAALDSARALRFYAGDQWTPEQQRKLSEIAVADSAPPEPSSEQRRDALHPVLPGAGISWG
jgi:hypothetical protein